MKILQRFALGLFAASLFFNGATRMFAAGRTNVPDIKEFRCAMA